MPEIWKAGLELAFSLRAKALHCGDEDCCRWSDARGAHDDVEVFLGAEISGESRFVDDVIGKTNPHLLREQTAGTMRNVSEGTGMYEGRCSLCGLHEVGHDCLVEQRHHCACRFKVGRGDGAARPRRSNDNRVEAAAQMAGVARGQGKNRHDLRRCRDDKTGLAISAVSFGADTDGDAAQEMRGFISMARGHVIFAGSRSSALPKKRWESIIAASRLCAAVIAWRSLRGNED